MHFGSETQAQSSQRMYDSRAANYEDSWHPAYAIRFASCLSITPGEKVLDLCCGTGLNVFAAAEKVGPDGNVVGVDVSDGMLALAREKQAANPEVGKRCLLLKGDVTRLDDVFAAAGLGEQKGEFDWITCSSAFVLLDDPSAALAQWKTFLKPGGRMAVDVPHEHNLRPGAILERVARQMNVALPFNRSWVESSESFIKLAEKEGLLVENFELLERIMGERVSYYSLGEADGQFDKLVNGSLAADIDAEEFKKNARSLYREEWAKQAVDGKLETADALYLYIIREAIDRL